MTATITSLRKVDWDSFRPNFFTLFAPGVLESMPQTYLGAAAPARRARSRRRGCRAWCSNIPNVLAIDVGEIMRQVQTIIEQVAKAVEFVFLFTLLGGLLVLQAAIAATQDERRFDAAILRTLGASRAQLPPRRSPSSSCWARSPELLAAAGATALGYVLSDRVFQIPFSANPMVWLYGVGRRRDHRDARRLARHARHDAPAAARGDPAARLVKCPNGRAVASRHACNICTHAARTDGMVLRCSNSRYWQRPRHSCLPGGLPSTCIR